MFNKGINIRYILCIFVLLLYIIYNNVTKKFIMFIKRIVFNKDSLYFILMNIKILSNIEKLIKIVVINTFLVSLISII
jgi:hypothetical protein